MEKLIARKEVEHIHEEFARILKRKVDSECELLWTSLHSPADEQSGTKSWGLIDVERHSPPMWISWYITRKHPQSGSWRDEELM